MKLKVILQQYNNMAQLEILYIELITITALLNWPLRQLYHLYQSIDMKTIQIIFEGHFIFLVIIM